MSDPIANNPQPHWDTVYRTKAVDEVSWYQAHPERSLALVRAAAPDPAAAIIDVGCGAGTLLATLAAAGYRDLTGLDVSAEAIAKAKARLGAVSVDWIVADITRWRPERTWQVWHDRAVFHFLIDAAAQEAYLGSLAAALRPGGTAILATFALDGPERCSGLPIQRYSPATLAARLGEGFRLHDQAAERHLTPKGAEQRFSYAVFERR
jgi:2-polyprenyl-3-methyl-5-hydroxy-6-metoxy-1,4-benzoquinol methylase